MNVINAILNRHSYRGKYKSEPVPRKDLVQIMEVGLTHLKWTIGKSDENGHRTSKLRLR